MARALIPYAGTLKAMPITELIADFANARDSYPFSSYDSDLLAIDLDGSVALWWFIFDGAATPTSWHDQIAFVDLSDYGTAETLQYAFTRDPGGTYYAFPRGVSLASWADYRELCTEIDDGLYVVTVSRDYDLWDIFEGSAEPTWVETVGVIYTGSSGEAAQYTDPNTGHGSVGNLLSVDYEQDWVYLDGIEDVGLTFGGSRATSQIAPASGVKAKRGTPDHKEVAVAATTFGYEPTDIIFVVFAQTLMSGTTVRTAIRPKAGDFIVAFDATYVIKSCKNTVDFSQWRCYCRRSVLEE